MPFLSNCFLARMRSTGILLYTPTVKVPMMRKNLAKSSHSVCEMERRSLSRVE